MADSSTSGQETELTMCDVLQEEEELEDDANAVLGGSDDTNCSYDKGYVPRQALYACMTCTSSGDAGVCLACCYACHDGHEVVELYTKRDFRCDCGNSKFNNKKCTLKPDKEPVNPNNKYNQNFKGMYCSCSRPYPDPDDSVPDEMIQCIMCEDWFHGRHLKVSIADDYFEMICFKCMASHKFLYSYQKCFEIKVDDKPETIDCKKETATLESTVPQLSADVSSTVSLGDSLEANQNTPSAGMSPANGSVKCEDKLSTHVEGEATSGKDNKANGSVIDDKQAKTNVQLMKLNSDTSSDCKDKSETCMLRPIDADKDVTCGSTFWPENWRLELCRCQHCTVMYAETGCSFLLDSEDTIKAYEERGKGSGRSQYESGLSALGQLDRVKQMEAVRAYTNMKGALKEYLRGFAEQNRTVCESDIKEFFERMGKRQKLNNGVPHFCR